MHNRQRRNQDGNALFMVLVGVVLFAALSFTFSKGSQQGGENISTRQAELAASDIITFSQRTGRTVDDMLRKNVSETQISFEGLKDGYTNAACSEDRCKVFVTTSGIQPVYPMEAWLDKNYSGDYAYLNWYLSAQLCVPGVPDNTCTAPKGNDLLLILPYVRKALCETINDKIGIANPPPDNTSVGSIAANAQFDGSFTPTGGATLLDGTGLDGKTAACVHDSNSDAYYYYSVLIAR